MKMSNYDPVDHVALSRVSWFALGLLSGAAVALLTTPMNGRENRQVIRRRAKQMADSVAQDGGAFLNSQTQRVNEVFERGRSEVQALGSRVNDALEQGKGAYRAAKDRFQANASEVAQNVTQKVDDMASRTTGH